MFERGRPRRGEARDDASAPRVQLLWSEVEPDCRAPTGRDQEVAQPGSVEVRHRSGRDVEGQVVCLSSAVVDEHHALGVSDEGGADLLRHERAAASKDEGDLSSQRVRGQGRVELVRMPDAAELAIHGPPVGPRTEPRSTSVWSCVSSRGRRAGGGRSGTGRSGGSTAHRALHESDGAKTWRFDEAATVIASGAEPGESMLPRPKSSRSLPAAITARLRRRPRCSRPRSARRSQGRSPRRRRRS